MDEVDVDMDMDPPLAGCLRLAARNVGVAGRLRSLNMVSRRFRMAVLNLVGAVGLPALQSPAGEPSAGAGYRTPA